MMKTTSLAVAALSLAGCHHHDSSDDGALRLGTYTTCSQGQWSDSGLVLNVSGFQNSSASATVTQKDGQLLVSHVDENANPYTFAFSEPAGPTATLASTNAPVPGFTGECPEDGPGSVATFPAIMTAESGTLTTTAGALFVAVQGTVSVDEGTCGDVSAASAAMWIVCETPPAKGAAATSTPDLVSTLPAASLGSYTCEDFYTTHYLDASGHNEYGLTGEGGTLVLTQTGSDVVAAYSGDATVSGTLRLEADSISTALGEANQQLTARCTVPILPPGPSTAPATLPIASASLTVNGTTAILTFTGTMGSDSTCSGAQVASTLVCTQ